MFVLQWGVWGHPKIWLDIGLRILYCRHMIQDPQLMWAAGFFCGEGTTWVRKQKNGLYRACCISIGQKNREVLDRFQEAVKCGSVYPENVQKDFWKYTANGEKAVQILSSIWPGLSIEKREQAIKVFQALEEFECSRTRWLEKKLYIELDTCI